jgi:hypothetical protein
MLLVKLWGHVVKQMEAAVGEEEQLGYCQG